MKTSSAKAKGRRCAQEVKELLLKSFSPLLPDDIKVTPSGVTGEDLWLSPLARVAFPYTIECKNVEALNIWKALEQAESHNPDFPGILFFRRNRSKLYVALSAEDFMKLFTRK